MFNIIKDAVPGVRRTQAARLIVIGAAYALVAGGVATSAIILKQFRAGDPLAAIDLVGTDGENGSSMMAAVDADEEVIETVPAAEGDEAADEATASDDEAADDVYPAETRWFNGRPVRPARVITMVATGYSPDARSCGDSADGITASLHSVFTNGHRLVAADTKVLPFGSMLSIPGYDTGQIVPVLDRGSAIKGRRLDLLFPTHEQALVWGVRKVKVTVWAYADGKPADNPRALR